jgi:ParB family transcriptional regulator, chromosome partitioning protein
MANQGLGRGLSSLIPQKINKKEEESSQKKIPVNVLKDDESEGFFEINPDEIKVNPMQPRHDFDSASLNELVESIKEYGLIQPLVLTKNKGQYELIAGERRLRACKIIGLEKVPAVFREADEQKKLGMALVENIQRQDLNSIETALAYKKLNQEFGLTNEEIAQKVGKARTSVSNTLRMLNLPGEIQEALKKGRIGEGHAKYLLGISKPEKQMILFRKILNNNLSVNDTNKEARRLGGTRQAKIKINYKDKDKEFAFREFFGTKVEIKRGRKGGQIIIDFFSDDELDGFVSKLKG